MEPEEKRMRDVITNNNAIKVTDEVYKNEASTEMPIKINKAQKASKLVEFFNKLSTAVKIGTGKGKGNSFFSLFSSSSRISFLSM